MYIEPPQASYVISLSSSTQSTVNKVYTFNGSFDFIDSSGNVAVTIPASASVNINGLTRPQVMALIDSTLLANLQLSYNNWKTKQNVTAAYLSTIENYIASNLVF